MMIENRGQPIRGSCFFRDFCAHCGEPMRVKKSALGCKNYCQDCNGLPAAPAHTGLCQRQRYKLGHTDG